MPSFAKPRPRERKAMQESNGPKFPVGSIVRVRQNRTDVGYPDRPFAGWVGRVIEVQEGVCTTCLVRWNQQTLAANSPPSGHWCEGDGMGLRETWLDEDDIGHDDGNSIPVEQPTSMPRSDDRVARIRSVFGLSSGDVLPRTCQDALLIYHEHFAARMSFPFDGNFQQRAEPLPESRCVTVVRLLQRAVVNDSDGILCRAVDDKGARGVPLAKVQVALNSVNSELNCRLLLLVVELLIGLKRLKTRTIPCLPVICRHPYRYRTYRIPSPPSLLRPAPP